MQVLTVLLGITCLAAQTQAKTINVNVGDGGQLVFNPDSVTAAVGDTVQFSFVKGNHSVAQSVSFDKPCHPAPNGIYSGYLPALSAPANQSFVVTINDTNPIWYYCSQYGHCGVQAAMVGVINPPANATVDSFINKAKGDVMVEKPGGIMGGVFVAATGNATSNGTSSSGGSSPTASSSAGSSGTGTATGSAATTSRTSGAWVVDATAASGVGGVVALFAAMLL